MPAGGLTGELLTKATDNDFDTAWAAAAPVRRPVVYSYSATFTPDPSYENCFVVLAAATAAVTLPANTVPIPYGAEIEFSNSTAQGNVPFTAGSGATLDSRPGLTLPWKGVCKAKKIAVNGWRLYGDLVPTPFSDTMDGAVDTPLTARGYYVVPTAASYANQGLKLDGAGNAVPIVAAPNDYGGAILTTSFPEKQWVEVDFIVPSSGTWNIRFYGRIPDQTPTHFGYGVSVGGSGTSIRENDSTITSFLAYTWTLGQQYTARLEISGNTVTTFINGVAQQVWTDPSAPFRSGGLSMIAAMTSRDKITAHRMGAL